MILFRHAQEKKSHTFKAWLDSQNSEGFTALHFCSFHGNMRLMQVLIEEGSADMGLANKNGCNVVHLAAQGNKGISVYYFTEKMKMDVNVRDNKGSTALHWACFTKSEVAL